MLSRDFELLAPTGRQKVVLKGASQHLQHALQWRPGVGVFLLKAQLCHRDVTLAINQGDRLPFRKGRKSEVSKARRFGVRLEQEKDFALFWEQVLVPHLKKQYWAAPVHSLDEIRLLASRSPENIKQFSAYLDGEIVAGTTIFETPNVAHAQYIGASEKGRQPGALDYLIAWLITGQYGNKKYFDFGSCNQSDRLTLNVGLLRWKEGFGGRCYSHDFYEIATDNYPKLEAILESR